MIGYVVGCTREQRSKGEAASAVLYSLCSQSTGQSSRHRQALVTQDVPQPSSSQAVVANQIYVMIMFGEYKLFSNILFCRVGSVMVSVLATGPKGCGFKPGRGNEFLRATKIGSTTSF
jgi:hypothetical protein